MKLNKVNINPYVCGKTMLPRLNHSNKEIISFKSWDGWDSHEKMVSDQEYYDMTKKDFSFRVRGKASEDEWDEDDWEDYEEAKAEFEREDYESWPWLTKVLTLGLFKPKSR